jgi:sodium-dependent dicarboxylate transporter 2/3/5
MAVIFAITALLWLSREPVPGFGWAPALGLGRDAAANIVYAEDATVAMLMALVCFVLPSKEWRGPRLLDWETASRAPWGILLLFGGGLALAQGMEATGLDVYLGRWLAERLADTPRIAIMAGTSLGMTFFTELTGNLSCVSMSMPILKTLSQEVQTDPRLLMIPAAVSASCAFMLPVATPPNAIVYSAGVVQIRDMVKAGFILNLLGVALVVVFMYAVGVPLLGIDTTGLPDWAAEPVKPTP